MREECLWPRHVSGVRQIRVRSWGGEKGAGYWARGYLDTYAVSHSLLY